MTKSITPPRNDHYNCHFEQNLNIPKNAFLPKMNFFSKYLIILVFIKKKMVVLSKKKN